MCMDNQFLMKLQRQLSGERIIFPPNGAGTPGCSYEEKKELQSIPQACKKHIQKSTQNRSYI